VTVLRVSGNADKRTSLFTLHGVQTKLTHTFTDTCGFGSIVGAIYVLDEGTNLSVDGGIPEVTVIVRGDSLERGMSHYLIEQLHRWTTSRCACARWLTRRTATGTSNP
jgi:hypothetical protein